MSPAPNTYDEVVRLHGKLAERLHFEFKGKLSSGECEDLISDALLEGHVKQAAEGQSVQSFSAWVRETAHHDAMDRRRKLEGESKATGPRSFTHEYDDLDQDRSHAGPLAPEQAAEENERRKILLDAYAELTPDERQILFDRLTLEIPVAECAERRGLSRDKFERRQTAAIKSLRLKLARATHDDCRQARFELELGRSAPHDAPTLALATAHAHLDDCDRCRWWRKTTKKGGMLGTLPLPAIGLIQRLLHRLPGFGQHSDRIAPAGAGLSDAAATVAPVGAAAGTGGALLFSGAGAKTVAVGCSLLAGGACIFGGQAIVDELERDPAKPAARVGQKRSTSARPLAPKTALGVVPATTTVRDSIPTPVRPARTVAKASSSSRTTTGKKRSASKRSSDAVLPSRAGSGGGGAVLPTPAAAPSPGSAVLPTPAPAPAPATAPAPAAVVPTPAPKPAGSSFSGEFGP